MSICYLPVKLVLVSFAHACHIIPDGHIPGQNTPHHYKIVDANYPSDDPSSCPGSMAYAAMFKTTTEANDIIHIAEGILIPITVQLILKLGKFKLKPKSSC